MRVEAHVLLELEVVRLGGLHVGVGLAVDPEGMVERAVEVEAVAAAAVVEEAVAEEGE